MTLKIGFVKRPPGSFVPLAWAIEALEYTKYSHVYLRYDDNGDTVFQCNLSGTEPQPASDFFKTYVMLEEYDFVLDDSETELLKKFVEQYRGTDYSYLQLMTLAFYEKTGIKLSCLKPLIRGMVCSELAYRFWIQLPQKFIRVESLGADPKFVGLRSMHDFVSTHPARVLTTIA